MVRFAGIANILFHMITFPPVWVQDVSHMRLNLHMNKVDAWLVNMQAHAHNINKGRLSIYSKAVKIATNIIGASFMHGVLIRWHNAGPLRKKNKKIRGAG